MKISDLFEVKYGVNLELSSCEKTDWKDSEGINFVARTSTNNGVVAKVAKIEGIEPQAAGTLSCAAGGSVLSTFLQAQPYYSGRDLYILTPKREMSMNEKLYWCMVIKANAYRFNYGRQANKTLKDIMLPDTVPAWVESTKIVPVSTKITDYNIADTVGWKDYTMDSLFHFVKGKRLTKEDMIPGNLNFLGAISENNGVREKIETGYCWDSNCITVNYNGSVGEAFYQLEPFWASDDVNVLYAKDFWKMNKYNAMFLITVIKANKYRFGYGRKWTIEKMKETVIKLPSQADGTPDFMYMENYIKSLSYSDRI
ncbi:MAG: restriction endonuclease subunit S [Lachnospiraceae bacterium]|nr:restriction endonuclease subunit S [Lachnospiraceae bacterium]